MQTFSQFYAAVWWALLIVEAVGAPVILLYVCIRVLRDLRRIAASLERLAESAPVAQVVTSSCGDRPETLKRRAIPYSLFGR